MALATSPETATQAPSRFDATADSWAAAGAKRAAAPSSAVAEARRPRRGRRAKAIEILPWCPEGSAPAEAACGPGGVRPPARSGTAPGWVASLGTGLVHVEQPGDVLGHELGVLEHLGVELAGPGHPVAVVDHHRADVVERIAVHAAGVDAEFAPPAGDQRELAALDVGHVAAERGVGAVFAAHRPGRGREAHVERPDRKSV